MHQADDLARIAESQCTLYFHETSAILHLLKKTIVNSMVSETLLENMWEDCNVDDVLYVLGNPQKRHRCTNIAGAIPTRSRIRYVMRNM